MSKLRIERPLTVNDTNAVRKFNSTAANALSAVPRSQTSSSPASKQDVAEFEIKSQLASESLPSGVHYSDYWSFKGCVFLLCATFGIAELI